MRHEFPAEDDGNYLMIDQGSGNVLELGDVVEFGVICAGVARVYCPKRGAANVYVHKLNCELHDAVAWAKRT